MLIHIFVIVVLSVMITLKLISPTYEFLDMLTVAVGGIGIGANLKNIIKELEDTKAKLKKQLDEANEHNAPTL